MQLFKPNIGEPQANRDAPPLCRALGNDDAAGATVLPVITEVARGEQVEALGEKGYEEFAGVHLL